MPFRWCLNPCSAARRAARAMGIVRLAGMGVAAALGCGQDGPSGGPLLVATAASVSAAMAELVTAFEEESGLRVTETSGASGQLAQQIREGAPIDVFLSADRDWIERLAAEGRIVPGTAAVYARGVLVLFQAANAETPVARLTDLTNPGIRRIAIANPESAPYGRAARQALESAGVLAAVEARIVIAENVRQTVQYVETSGVDVAFTSRALMEAGSGRWTVVPADLYDPLEQSLGVMADRPNEAGARAFAEFVLGPRGREILSRFGFEPPEGPGS